jgi:hypothetical protein
MTLSPSRFLVFLLASALLGGCLSPRTRGPAATTPVQLVDLNPVLAPGVTALLAARVVATDDGPSHPPTRLTLTLGDQEIPARLYWAWAQVPGAGLRATWLEPPLRWRLTLEPPAGGSFASPLIIADIPPDGRPEWLQVEGTRVRPIWLEEDGELWWRDLQHSTSDPGPLLSTAQPEAEDPTRSWRAVLLADRLHSPQQPARLTDPLTQALAEQQLSRWRTALDRLAAADLELARELRRRLTVICRDVESLVPAWPTDEDQLADVLQTLLSPAHDDQSRATMTRAWLNGQPRVLAWPATTGKRGWVAVGLANVTSEPLSIRLRWSDSYEAPRAIQLAPESLQRLSLRFPPDLPPAQLLHTVSIEVGEQVQQLRFTADPTPARPPGLVLGPFLQPRSLRDWQRGQYAMDAADHATRAAVRRTDEGWELFIECRGEDSPQQALALLDPRRLRATDLIGEAVYLFIGPVDNPLAVFAVTRSGTVQTFSGSVATSDVSVARRASASSSDFAGASPVDPASAAPGSLRSAPNTPTSSVWSATIRLPAEWIDEEGLIPLGLIRSYESGAAPTSFPQPVFPWNLEPGRLLIDTSQWDELAGMRPL